jgi:hypothetical protein
MATDHATPRKVNRQSLIGQRFHRLLVVANEPSSMGKRHWRCVCDCGREAVVPTGHLRNGHTRSCGCLHDEATGNRARIHGKSGTPEFWIWCGIKKRCYEPRSTVFRYYGGRGIKVCDRWRESFAAFLEDMGPRPSPDHSIDRVDPNGDYRPENCRWATTIEQRRNCRSNRVLTHDGQSLCIAEWAERTGIRPRTISARLKLGWSVGDALTIPPYCDEKRRLPRGRLPCTQE